MPDNIKLHLMENRSIRAEFNGRPYFLEGGINIVAGEQNATQFQIASVPERLSGATVSLAMTNSLREAVSPPLITNNIFVLPIGMAVAGYGQFVITLEKNGEKVVFLPFKVKVKKTNPNWKTGIITVLPFALGATKTLPAGSKATVENVGTNLNPVLEFGIPQGLPGESGFVSQATTTEFGGIKIGYSTNQDNYAVQLNSDGQAYVHIPLPDIPTLPDIIITDSGSGNAVTGIAASGHTITVTKGETFAKNADLTALGGRVTTIEGKIPAQASATNQLADRAFVNSTVQTATANFRGNWATWAAVPTDVNNYPVDYAGSKTPTVNDYLVVQDASGYSGKTLAGTWRFKYSGTWGTNGKNGWQPEYQVNEKPLTAAQLAALNSGITAAGVAQITTNKDDIAAVKTTADTILGNYVTLDTEQTIKKSKYFADGSFLTVGDPQSSYALTKISSGSIWIRNVGYATSTEMTAIGYTIGDGTNNVIYGINGIKRNTISDSPIEILLPEKPGTLLVDKDKGVANGVASLGPDGKVPSEQLPDSTFSDSKAFLASHPVKSLYWSDDPTSPAQFAGGSWEELPAGTFIMAAGSSGRAGQSGGSNSVTLTVGQLPKHQHGVAWTFDQSNGRDTFISGEAVVSGGLTQEGLKGYEAYTNYVGNNEPFDNRPQHTTTHTWRRVA